MRIGFVVYGSFGDRSGGFRYDRQLTAALRDAGETVEPIELPWRAYARGLLDNLSPSLRNRLDAGYDVLLQDELAHPSLVVTNRCLSTPVVSIVHLLRATEPRRFRSLYRTVERWYLGGVDGVVCNSTDTRDLVTDLGVAAEASVVAPPTGNRFDPDEENITIAAPAPEEPLRLIFVGNISQRKGLDTLIAGINAVDTTVELTVVGQSTDDCYLTRVRQQVIDCGLSHRVTFTGELTDTELESTLRDHHVLAVPSRYEPFGIVYAEAMSFGLPVIAARAGGATDIVTDGKTGFLIDPGDSAAVADAITTLAADRKRLATMGQAARERYEAQPDWTEIADSVRMLLRSVVSDGSV